MSASFSSPKRRLARARQHIDALDTAVAAFFTGEAGDPFEQVMEKEFVGIEMMRVLKLRQRDPMPDELSDLAVEAIDAVRSALDQACYASAAVLGKPNSKSAYFPFADTEGDLENTIKGRCKDLRPEIVTLLRAFAPFEAGNQLLWAFNKVRQSNQHKISCGVGTDTGGTTQNEVLATGSVGLLNPIWDQERRELRIAQFASDAHIRIADYTVNLYATLSDAGILTGKPLVGSIRKFASMAESIVLAIEAETLRLKSLSG